MTIKLTNIELIPRDKTLEAYRYQIEVLKKLGAGRRSKSMGSLCRGVRCTLKAGIRMRHPNYDNRQMKIAFIRLFAGEEAFRKLLPLEKVDV